MNRIYTKIGDIIIKVGGIHIGIISKVTKEYSLNTEYWRIANKQEKEIILKYNFTNMNDVSNMIIKNSKFDIDNYSII